MGSVSIDVSELSALDQAAHEASAAAKFISSYCELSGIPNPAFGPEGPDATPLRDAPVAVRDARQRLLGAALKLQQLATDPAEHLSWLSCQYQIITAIHWLCHFEVLSALPMHGVVKYTHVSSICNVPVRQLESMARMAMASNFLCEPEPGRVAHSALSRYFAVNHAFPGWIRFMTGYYMPCAAKSISATEKWGETTNKHQTASNLAMDTTLSSFDFITQSKDLGRLFSGYMKGVHAGIATNVSQVVEDYSWASIGNGLVVHVDGSPGHVAIALAKAHPSLRFVVQDAAETLRMSRGMMAGQPAQLRNRIQTKVHSRFETQPILDADVYILRMTLHNYSDDEAVRILNALLPALKGNPAARLLIIETVLSQSPGMAGNPRDEAMERYRDLVMLQVFSAKERNLQEFEKLLADASDSEGKIIIKSVRKSPGATISTMEVAYEKL
ncbi:hypothetical protein N0V82_002378 [Gnomoniopsis sp. IMI 355080]|nr:hypothetical protein N0V82_002378 [Gnomoniopsis sp. IMI 355080]